MAAVNNVPQLVDKKGGSYAAIAPKLELRKFTKGDDKPESQWTPDERRVVVQYQRLKSIIMSCLPDDIIESVIGCETAKATWTDLDFQENSDDEVDERSSEEYLRDLDIEFQERALLANSKRFIKRRNKFSSQKANENTECYKCGKKGHFVKNYFFKTSEPSYKSPLPSFSLVSKDFQSSQNSINLAKPKIQKDYKAGYKKIKAKLALLEANPSTSQIPKTFQPKNKGLVAKTFDWDEEEVLENDEVTQVKVLMSLADDELTVGKNHARNGEWIDITMRKVNILLSMDEDVDWQNYLKYINIDLKFVEEQRLNLLSKYNKIVFELNKCTDELLVLK
ncbi:hypothetical protein Tco_0079540 [Tanacetum coccineum]